MPVEVTKFTMGEGDLVQIDVDDLLWLLVSCFIWSTFYFTLCIVNPKRSYEWHIRIVTLTHATLISALGAYGALVIGPWPFTNSGGPSTLYQHSVIIISLGYFLLDFSWCLYFNTEGAVMLVHHCLSITGLGVCFMLRYYGIEMLTTLFGTEITNPLLQLRWFLRETNNYDTLLGDIVDIAFMTLFGLFRIGLGSILLYCYFSQETTDWLGRLAGVLIYSLSWVFWVSIVQYGIKKYKRRRGKSKANDQSNSESATCNNNHSSDKITSEHMSNGSIHVNGHIQGTENGSLSKEGLHKRHVNGCVNEITEGNLVYGPDLNA